jgi:carbon storage regulator
MLVLSRRPNEKILLPSIPAVIQVISAQANLVRLGLEAPAHVPILREELARAREALPADGRVELPTELRPGLRNCVNNLILGLTLLRLHLGEAADPVVGQSLAGMEEELQALCRYVAAPAREPPNGRPQPHLAAPVGP